VVCRSRVAIAVSRRSSVSPGWESTVMLGGFPEFG
jgi:hypothetical protein